MRKFFQPRHEQIRTENGRICQQKGKRTKAPRVLQEMEKGNRRKKKVTREKDSQDFVDSPTWKNDTSFSSIRCRPIRQVAGQAERRRGASLHISRARVMRRTRTGSAGLYASSTRASKCMHTGSGVA